MQLMLRKIKNHLDEKEYKKLYPTNSRPGLSYDTAMMHKEEKVLMN